MEKFLQEKGYQTDNFNPPMLSLLPPMLTLLNEIEEKSKNSKQNLKSSRKVKVLPGSYKSVLNRRNKDFGCLFWESKARNENGTVQSKVEGDFILLARKRFKKIRISGQPKPVLKKTKPIVQYSSNCHLCKMSSVVPKVQGKPWRKHSFIDINRNELGVMITRDKNDFSVHQACMDYAHGENMVQNYEILDGVEKLDGYNVKHVKELRGSKCKFCKKPRGLTACYVSKCKSFYHLPCGILNGSVQVKEELTSYCPRHSQEAIRDKVGYTKIVATANNTHVGYGEIANTSQQNLSLKNTQNGQYLTQNGHSSTQNGQSLIQNGQSSIHNGQSFTQNGQSLTQNGQSLETASESTVSNSQGSLPNSRRKGRKKTQPLQSSQSLSQEIASQDFVGICAVDDEDEKDDPALKNILKNIEVIYVENLQNPDPINFREVEDEVYEVAQTTTDLPVSVHNNVINDNNTFSDTSEISNMFSSDEEDEIPNFESETPNQSFNGTNAGSTNGSNMIELKNFNDKKRQLSEDETAENTESPKNKTIRTYIYASDIDIEEHHPIKIENEIDLSTTENMMQLQNNSEQKEMETLKKALQNERNENIELRQENADLTQDKKRLNILLEEKDKNNAQLKSELKDIKSYLRQIREGSKKFL